MNDGPLPVLSLIGALTLFQLALSAAVRSMVQSGGHVWCGCEGGQICVFSLENGSLIKTFKAHADTVDTLAVVGNQVRKPWVSVVIQKGFKFNVNHQA